MHGEPIGAVNPNGFKEAKMAKDLICGMQVDEQAAAGTSKYQGKTYYFCSTGCKAAFEKEPEKYVNPQNEKAGSHHHH